MSAFDVNSSETDPHKITTEKATVIRPKNRKIIFSSQSILLGQIELDSPGTAQKWMIGYVQYRR